MASAHVLPNLSKKQDHLQAGKRRLEEFRKKRASGGAKKAVSSNQLHELEKLSSNVEKFRATDSDVVSMSNNVVTPVFVSGTELGSEKHEVNLRNEGLTRDGIPKNGSRESGNTVSDISNNNPAFHFLPVHDSSQTRHSVENDTFSAQNNGPLKDFYFPTSNSARFSVSMEKDGLFVGPPTVNSDSISSSSNLSSLDIVHPEISQMPESRNYPNSNGLLTLDRGERNPTISARDPRNASGASQTQNVVDSELDFRNPYYPFLNSGTSNTGTRRSRTSFLDSLNIPRVLGSPPHLKSEEMLKPGTRSEPELGNKAPNSRSETLFPMIEEPISSFPEASSNSSQSGAHLEPDAESHDIYRQTGLQLRKHDDGFAALEQHIEDLTQEKFSLQNTLEASRVLAESLAAENSSLTNNYNQQGIIVSELKQDMEKLRQELRAQLVELGSVNAGFTNAQLECHAADERAKLLASEVIGLEEKALRLRSSELKLEKQLEQSNSEIVSHRKKISNLEKERRDLQTTVEALQEDKKKLHTKVRNASGSGTPADTSRSVRNIKIDVSTSTEDLDARTNISTGFADSRSDNAPENGPIDFERLSSIIPADHVTIIGNIQSLISELASEKEELMRNLAMESSHNTYLKELNSEFAKKLDAQTQRLELLTAQSIAARGNTIPAKGVDPDPAPENTAMQADEGDEVVERVLAWIMKLFPGGPSRRRPNKRM